MSAESFENSLVEDFKSSDGPGSAVMDKPQANEEAPVRSSHEVREAVKKDNGANDLSLLSQEPKQSSLMTIDEAKQNISAEILSVLADRFNGKLSEVRPVDKKDILF